jgi:hypothetical protein
MHSVRNKRASSYHRIIYHGISSYQLPFSETGGPPAATNSDRQHVHVVRSGRFVPPVFSPRTYELIVNDEIKRKLQVLPNVEFSEVVFEQLVDLSMPRWGDFSFEQWSMKEQVELHTYIKGLPDRPEMHDTIGRYYTVLGANLAELRGEVNDLEEDVRLNFGTYWPSQQRETTLMSRKALEKYPFARGGTHILRDDAFTIIAPYLDLDMFEIAVINSDAPVVPELRISPFERYRSPSDD